MTDSLEFLTRDPDVAAKFPIGPTNRSMPDWWAELPQTSDGLEPGPTNATIRRCPGINTWAGLTFTVPLWADLQIKVVDRRIVWQSDYQMELPMLDFMRPAQHQGHLNAGLDLVLKFQSPWRVKCPPGWSFAVLPVSYEPDPRITVHPGVVHGDVFHVLNCIAAWNGPDSTLEAGMPLCEILPFKREPLAPRVMIVDNEEWVSGNPRPTRTDARPPHPGRARAEAQRRRRAR